MSTPSSIISQPSKQLELWTNQQREFQNAAAAADAERTLLMERLQQTKSRSAQIRQATLQAQDALGKHHTVRHQLQAQKKQLERQLKEERALSEDCVAQLAQNQSAALAFQKQAADQYHALNKEIAQVNQEMIDDIVNSYITVDSVHLLEPNYDGRAGPSAIPGDEDTATAYVDLKRDLAEHAKLEDTRNSLLAQVQSLRARVLEDSANTASITEASLLELERNWSIDFATSHENRDANDTFQLQLFYGHEDQSNSNN